MKKLFLFCAVCATLFLCGCRTTPSETAVLYVAETAGRTAAYVLNKCDIDGAQREAIASVFARLDQYVPQAGQSVEEAWTPVAEEHVRKLVEDGRLSEVGGKAVLAAFRAALVGVRVVEARYPAIAASRSLATAAVRGFVTGFVAVFDTCPDCHDGLRLADQLRDREVGKAVYEEAARAGLVGGGR